MEIFVYLSRYVSCIFLEEGEGEKGELRAIYKQILLLITIELNILDVRPGSQMPSGTLSKFSKIYCAPKCERRHVQ